MADVRKIKVESVEFNREYKLPNNPKVTLYYFDMTTEDGISGQFSTNTRDQKKFLVGQEYEVEIIEKQNARGIYYSIDISEAEKEARKANYQTGGQGKKGWQPYVKSRPEVMSIISQSSFEAAVLIAKKVNSDKIEYKSLATISKILCEFIVDQAGLNSSEVKSDNKEALRTANERAIVYQKALKIAVECFDMKAISLEFIGEPPKVKHIQAVINITEHIVKDITEIANGL